MIVADPQKAPSMNVAETPEFRAAVAEAAKTAVAEALAAAREAVGTPTNISDTSWAETFAMAIAQLTDQGTGRRRVAPQILKQRQQARDLMVRLIIEARADGRVPSYRLTNKVVLDDQLVDPAWIDKNHTAQPTEIDWPGVPNEAMVPINDTARAIFTAFRDSIGSVDKDDADVLGRLNGGPLSVTPGGLVVKTSRAGGKRSLQAQVDAHNGANGGGEGLSLRHKDQPGRYKEVKILGTIAKPAQQSV